MTTIQIGTRKLTIADGCEVQITDTEINVKPAAQGVLVSSAWQYTPTFPQLGVTTISSGCNSDDTSRPQTT